MGSRKKRLPRGRLERGRTRSWTFATQNPQPLPKSWDMFFHMFIPLAKFYRSERKNSTTELLDTPLP